MKKLLIVGLGSIGRRHASNFTEYFNEIDIVDINPSRIDEAKSQFKIHKSYDDYTKALDSNKYDVVAITTPPHLHLPIAKLAAEKGSHLFIEKPMGMSIAGWQEVSEICDQMNLFSYVAFCHRHINYTKRLKDLVESEEIGRPIHANLRWGSFLPDWHPWEDYRTFYMAKKEQGGGALLDESHGIDLVRYILGEAKQVFAIVDTISDLEITSDDAAFLTLRMKNNVLVHINFDLAARAPRVNFEIIGTKGTLIWDRVDHSIKKFDSDQKDWQTEKYTKEDFLNMYPNQARHFIHCISTKNKPLIDLNDAIKTQEIIDAAFRSSENGNLINL